MSLESKTVMLRLAQDEVRHTELCGELLECLNGETHCSMPVETAPLATHEGTTLHERALRNIIYTTCLSETIASARLIDALEHTQDPYVRDITRLILRDEVLHGHFGFLFLDELTPSLGEELAASLGEYLTHAFWTLETILASPALKSAPSPSPGAVELGVIDPPRAYEVFFQTIENVIVPGLELRGVPARRAWEHRRRLG